jgi:hypothetical protein
MTRSHRIATRSHAAAFDLARLWCEAGSVIALRMWGLGHGLGPWARIGG